ncbi:MAG: MBL fold metallo-hydrolase [Nitrososphaerales archaeon]|nr:MBL fold metallo-hydrolase [Nitrososphaerales archaeon]
MTSDCYVTLFGGVGKIGGNSILVEDKGSMILLDLGKDFDRYGRFFQFPFTMPTRSVQKELIKTGLLPEIKTSKRQNLSLYVEYEGSEVKEPSTGCPLQHVFISHPHLDHSGFVTLLRSDLNINMGSMAELIFSSNVETRRDVTLENKLYWDLTKKDECKPRQKILKFHDGMNIEADRLKINPHSVDHSVPGAYGFVVESPSARIAYTGDFRFHGPAQDLSEKFKEELGEDRLDALIVEGTNMNFGRIGSEERVERDAFGVIEKSFRLGNKLIIVEVKSSDIDRINAFARVAKSLDSTIIVTTRVAYILDKIELSELKARLKYGVPKLKDDVRVFTKGRLTKWEKELLDRHQGMEVLDAKAITSPEKKTILIDSGRFNVFDATPQKGSLYIQSVSEHLSEGEEHEEERFLNSLALYGLVVYRLHSSGHASPLDLIEFINEVRPRMLVPIHTEHPEAFHEIFKDNMNVIIPEKNLPITVSS